MITLEVTNVLVFLKIMKRWVLIESQQRISGVMRRVVILRILSMQIDHDEFYDARNLFAFIDYLLDLLIVQLLIDVNESHDGAIRTNDRETAFIFLLFELFALNALLDERALTRFNFLEIFDRNAR